MTYSNLSNYKNNFAINFAKLMEKNLHYWLKLQQEERNSLTSLSSFAWYFGFSLIGFVPGKNESHYDLKIHCIFAAIIFIFTIIGNISITNKRYQDKIKKTLFPKLLTTFGDIHYKTKADDEILLEEVLDKKEKEKKSQIYKISNSVFEQSKLFNRPIQYRDDDDCFWGKYSDVQFKINETDFGYITKGKNKQYNELFKGLALEFKMNKKIKSRVFILSKMSFTKIPPNFEKVELEYEKFNKKYDVWVEKNQMGGSGQIEARYLLTTAFLDRFMQIQTSFRVSNIKCSVYDDSLLILLGTKKDLFEMNHLFGKIDDISQYQNLFNEFSSVLSFIDILNISSKTGL